MIPGDALFDAFINANILIILAYALWCGARFLLDRLGMRDAYDTHLRLLNAVFLAIVAAPFVLLAAQWGQAALGGRANLTLSDMVVAYYLNGGFEMSAAELERLVLLRDRMSADVMQAASPWAIAAIAVFVLGFALGLARLVMSVCCLRSIVHESYPWRRFGRVRLRLSDRTLVPFSTRGLRNFYVVLPAHMLGQGDEAKVALAHEFQHIRQGDITWEIVLELLKPLFFLNPAYHAWKRQVEQLRELSCDARVLARGRIGIRAYCETLMSVCQQTLRRDRVFAVAMPKVTLVTAERSGGQGGLEHRIKTLLSASQNRTPKGAFVLVGLPLVALILGAAMAIQSPGDWSQDRLMLSTVVNLERLDKINSLTTFGVPPGE
ncbi:M56 family metallopeptidase [Roseovarius faecimaris]|uniref:M56 family metallopeptidase n=1 Tax=Roseovarius faecimaris TaxID=2494550 RepID=A0A6I6IKQ5_9RHOB|nr:M56 family metallopeptidase [Roseovarius faecimaris]QGX97590.1 M56 family metallopeptidase [Roseovarius faecimaris]